MNRLRLFYIFSIFTALNQCARCQITALKLRKVVLSSHQSNNLALSDQPTFDVELIKTNRGTAYVFGNKNLSTICHGSFMPANVVIRSIHAEFLSFSLIKEKVTLLVECEFANMTDLQIFFKDIRKYDDPEHQKLPITGLFRYPINKIKYPSPNLIPVSTNNLFYKKVISRRAEVGADAAFYFVREKHSVSFEIEDADLVFLSKRFLLTLLIGTNKYGLCIEDYPDFVFIVRFENHNIAVQFITLVLNDMRMDRTVHCPLNWITKEHIAFMDTYQ